MNEPYRYGHTFVEGAVYKTCRVCGLKVNELDEKIGIYNMYCPGETQESMYKRLLKMKGGRSHMMKKKGMTKNQKLKLNKTAAAKKKVKATKK